ncbi:hypothetical protein CHGG_04472 [Chaetomium globosum CBS 148.51]|uniref:RRM domain-containing protein n=1 Tax=Chaetomium globosum (strain ATCC 6205 / CBS 148.51 / DSM 1962 / NBRC 6347 / NRRL 1970) TaxID=306901 RepID=Q2H174_CHAGB|nr:uncharacterized protein CHGG_04472 [Chaetomium globosum CBS 148.51]EAQ87853.1 hypothetical protein CHGG_04472 [Chaetomium globosum CBS 148.51]
MTTEPTSSDFPRSEIEKSRIVSTNTFTKGAKGTKAQLTSMSSPAFARTLATFQVNGEPTYTDTNASMATNTAIDNVGFYHPMNCRVRSMASTEQEVHALLLKGFSPNYRGDPGLARNQPAAVPADENCSLFVVGLSPDLTTHELLSGIRNIGRVYATHINPPDPARGHLYSAAKVIFFEREAAERFYTTHASTGFATPQHPHLRARVTWNRLTYQTDEVLHRGASPDGARVLLEFRFGSYRCQAEAARMALMREFREVGVVCVYGGLHPLLGSSECCGLV